jgi:maltose/moltooligosaccharide transporter
MHPLYPRFRITYVIIIGLGLFAAQFAWVIYNTYVPIFLQAGSPLFDAQMGSQFTGFGLTAVQTGFVMSLDNLVALFLQPLSGAASDRAVKRGRWGRRMPYLLLGMPLSAASIALIPVALPGSGLGFGIFVGCLLLLVVAMAVWRAPLFALMADLTPSRYRTHANGILNLMAGLGGVLAFGIGSLLYAGARPLPFWAAGAVLLLACLLVAAWIREPSSQVPSREGDPGLLASVRAWRSTLSPGRRKSLLLLAAAVFCYMMGFHPIEAFFSSYGVSVLKLSEANSGLVLSAAYIAFILFAVPAGMLAARVGRKRAVLSGLVLFAVVLLVAFFTSVTAVMVVLMGLGGLAWALIDINAFPMVLDTAPVMEGSKAGTTAGIYFLATTLAATVGPVLNGGLIDAFGRNYALIFLIGPAFFGLSFLFLMGVKHGEAQA